MASNVKLAELIERVRRAADQENSNFVTDAQIIDWLNTYLAELYDLLVAVYEDYSIATVDLALTGASTQALPADFYKLISIAALEGSNEAPLKKFHFGQSRVYSQSSRPHYRIVGDNLEFKPTPNAGVIVRLRYIPVCPKLVNTTDTFDGKNRWEEYAVQAVAAQIAIKEESDPSPYMTIQDRLKKRLVEMAANRDLANCERIIDVTESYDPYDSSFPPRDPWE